jgi:hypothetical protein
MTARIFEWNAKSKHWRGLQPDARERTANATGTLTMRHPLDPPDTQPIDASARLAVRVVAVALVVFWCVVTVGLLLWREL